MSRVLKKLLGLTLAAAALFCGFWVLFIGAWFAFAVIQSVGR